MVKHKHYTIMETTEKKKHKSGFALLKEKLAKAEAENKELQKKFNEERERYNFTQEECDRKDKRLTEEIVRANKAEATIEQQSLKIRKLTAELKLAQGDLEATNREHERQLNAMYNHMGWFKRMTWDWHHAPTFKEDERWNETH